MDAAPTSVEGYKTKVQGFETSYDAALSKVETESKLAETLVADVKEAATLAETATRMANTSATACDAKITAFTRMNVPNHPSNNMLTCKRWELDFDDFLIFVDVLRPQPSTSELQGFSNRSNINRDHILQSHYGSDYLFPHPPLDAISLSAPDNIPAISHVSLFLHARSCLLATCTTEGFTEMEEMEDVETARSRWDGAAEPEFEWWEKDVDEGDHWPGDDGSCGEGSVSRLENDLDEGAESVLGSADSGNVEGPLEELLIDNSSDDFTASWVSQLQEEELLVHDEL